MFISNDLLGPLEINSQPAQKMLKKLLDPYRLFLDIFMLNITRKSR